MQQNMQLQSRTSIDRLYVIARCKSRRSLIQHKLVCAQHIGHTSAAGFQCAGTRHAQMHIVTSFSATPTTQDRLLQGQVCSGTIHTGFDCLFLQSELADAKEQTANKLIDKIAPSYTCGEVSGPS